MKHDLKKGLAVLKRETVIISLGNDAIRIGVCSGGEVVRSDRRFVSIDGIDALWRAGLRPLDDSLRTLLRDLQVRPGTPTVVVFHSPSTFADVFAAPSVGASAKAAAMLNLRQTLTPTPGGWQMRALPVKQVVPNLSVSALHVEAAARTPAVSESASDLVGGAGKTTKVEVKSEASKSTLMLMVAETNEHCDMIARTIERVGLRAQAIMPARAALLAMSLQADDQASSVPVVRVHVCEQTMTLLGWSGGQLLFARCTDAGYGLLTDALHRSAKSAGMSNDFTRELASRALFTSGIPSADQVLDVGQGLRGEHVLPLMQPALQRCIVEIRQTLRFGMSEADLDRSTIIIDGPGASIPGFIETLSGQLERPLESASSATATAVAEDSVGDLPIAASMLSMDELWLVPACERVRMDDQRLGVAVRAGAGVACALLGMWGFQAYTAGRNAQNQLAALQPRLAEISAAENVQREIAAVSSRATQVRALVRNGLGEYPAWIDVLAMIADHKLVGVEMTDLSYEASGDGKALPVLTIRGRAQPQPTPAELQLTQGVGEASVKPSTSQQSEARGENSRPRDTVVLLLQYFDKSPMVASTRILTNRIETGGNGIREFSVAVELKATRALPPEVVPAEDLAKGANLATESATGVPAMTGDAVDALNADTAQAPSLDVPGAKP